MDCSPPGPSVHGISQARILEWVAISFSMGSPQPRDQTWVSCVSCISRVDSLPLCHLGSPIYILKMLKKINKQKLHLIRVRRPGTSLEVHRLRRCTPNAGGLGSVSGQGLYPTCCSRDSHVPQLRPGAAKWIQNIFKEIEPGGRMGSPQDLWDSSFRARTQPMESHGLFTRAPQPPLPSTKAFSFCGRAGTSMWLPRVEVPELPLSSDLHKPISAGEISGSQFVSGQQRCLCDCWTMQKLIREWYALSLILVFSLSDVEYWVS